jgi:nucleotide-binding universal stress UspA family protein
MDRILVALDDSPHATIVLARAVALARQVGGKLRLLRAVMLPPEMPSNLWAVTPNKAVEGAVDVARQELHELAATVPEELLDGATAQIGVAWDAICATAREHDVDLIVIGSHGYRLLDRILGTTAAKVVNHADRSVLVVRPDEATRAAA